MTDSADTMAKKLAEHVLRLQAVVKAYRKTHSEIGCTCDICKQAEIVLTNIGYGEPFDFAWVTATFRKKQPQDHPRKS